MKPARIFAMAVLVSSGMAANLFGASEPLGLRCEYLTNPLAIDVMAPRLSWHTEQQPPATTASPRGEVQSAYQILVASTPDRLNKDEGDLWDSRKVSSNKSNQIEYHGKPLESRMRCYWKVRVWDGADKPSAWSQPASWAMGLLQPDDWQAQWIGYDEAYRPRPETVADDKLFNIHGLPWVKISGAKGKPSVDTCFRKRIEIPAERKVRRAVLALYAYNFCQAAINGTSIGQAAHWEQTARLDATRALHPGPNVVTLMVGHTDPYLPAVIGRLIVQFETGDNLTIPIDNSWKASQQPGRGYEKPDFDDSSWSTPDAGGPPWGGAPPVADLARVPAPYLRKDFQVSQAIKRATVYVTALGMYELRLNGRRVSNDVFAPGWTEFKKRVHYQAYDVTNMLGKGGNAIGAILGDGWYASDLAHLCRRNVYGGKPRLLTRLVIELADGSVQTVVSDPTWKASYGPIQHADLLMGCEYDSRLEMPGWDKPGFNDSKWQPVDAAGADQGMADVTAVVAGAIKNGRLSLKVENGLLGDPAYGQIKALTVDYQLDGKAQTRTVAEHGTLELSGNNLKITRARYGHQAEGDAAMRVQAAVVEPSQVVNELPAIKLTEPRPGCWTFDLGQNMVGWVRLKVKGAAGQRITLRHGEMLNPDGTIYTAALRSCPAADFFILSGKGEQVIEPYFTFHGFRYVEIRGLKSKPLLTDVTGRVVHTVMQRTGSFECSSAPLNQLYSNIIWGQKGNYLEVPTDCPQRDERMGWTGDTQFFAPTATYNFNVAAFFTRWLQTCEDDQNDDGTFPFCIPNIMGGGGTTAWGDAALLCTYQIYRAYGDTRIIEQRWAAMERYMKWLEGRANDGITRVGGFGDWLNAGGGASPEAMDTAYHAQLARIMAEMAKAIGRDDDAARYAKRHADVKAGFIRAFVQPDGSLKGCSQTGYALAFTMDLLPDELREKAAAKFVDEIKRFDWHLATGFIGTPRLLPALSAAGRDDVAYRLLLTDTYPSWLFPVKNGATTMWERWNGWTPDKGFGELGMNSFNHYAFGAVGEYLYGGVGGIKAASPGYQTSVIRPVIGDGLTWAKTSYDSMYGRIASNWKTEAGKLFLEVTIPPNTTATVYVPAKDPASVTESGKPANQITGGKFLKMDRGAACFDLGSGVYRFTSALAR